MTKVTVSIDGAAVEAFSHETILEAARRSGSADIPTLCHSPLLPPYGSCFVCVVEVEGARTLQPACATRVREGMVIHTATDRVRQTRTMALDLLLSAHWADCIGPCQMACPAGVDAQGYLALAREGKYAEAVELIKRVNPLPIVCGRVCVRACEVACERQKVDEPVGINFVKRYAAELERGEVYVPRPKPPIGKRVAIVGSGPSGLTCAYYLALEGVGCTIYEAWPKPGGMLRYGIPEYRLPKHLLDLEIGTITRLGVDIQTGVRLGKDVTLDSLRRDHDAVFVAVGAPVGQRMRVDGEDTTQGVLSGLDFLTRILLGTPLQVHGRVVVVGGGNTAIDAARTAFRLGADEVIILYRRTRKEMPADAVEIHAAEDEGVELQLLAAPVGIVSEDGTLKGINALRMELGEPDASGRRRPVPIPGSEYFIPCDFVFGAIGQATDLSWARGPDDSSGELARTKWDTVVVNDRTLETNIPGVFSGGDVVTGPSVAIEAISHGRRAAAAMVAYLTTGTAEAAPKPFYSTKERLGPATPEDLAYVPKAPRSVMPEADAQTRKRSWDETELGLEHAAVRQETERCLVCGCLDFGDCDLQRLATEYGADPTRLKGEVVRHRPDESHPFITLDNNKCILCGKCVAICRDLVGPAALGFVSRGFVTSVRPTLEVPLAESPCIGCGNCIDSCPTGALMDGVRYRKLREWRVAYHVTTCAHCAVGCPLRFATVAPGLFWVQTPQEIGEPSRSFLCQNGRYGHRYLSAPQRLNGPLIRENGALRPASWDEALERAASILRESSANENATAVIGSGTLTLEEAFLLQRIGRRSLATAHVGTGGQLTGIASDRALDGLVGFTGSTVPVAALDQADLVFVVGTDPASVAPVVDFRLHQALLRGATVVHIGPSTLGAGSRAAVCVPTENPAPVALALLRRLAMEGGFDRSFLRERCAGVDRLEYHLKNLSEEELLEAGGVDLETLASIAKVVTSASAHVVGIAGGGAGDEASLRTLALLLLCMGKMGVEGSGLLVLRADANDQGMPAVGLHPEFLPGRVAAPDGSVIAMRSALAGSVKAAVVVAEDPLATPEGTALLAGVADLVVLDAFATATTAEAKVVLPISAPAETTGRFFNLERRIAPLAKYAEPPAGKESWEVLAALEARLAGSAPFSTLAKLSRAVDGILGGAGGGTGEVPEPLFLRRFLTASGLAELGKPDVLAGVTVKIERGRTMGSIGRWVHSYLVEARPSAGVSE
ncbi:FAD-dependent oxidoreductase [Candidatus Fermentibacteria bacterium]|nr:FAD-dependent oxidoreductase [Candidatus Fermentibacteria bacterium]